MLRHWKRELCWARRSPDKTELSLSCRPSRFYRKGNLCTRRRECRRDALAVVDPSSARVLQRFSTDHYPYAVEAAADGNVYVSAWASNTISMFRTQADGTLSNAGRLTVGPHPSALTFSQDGSRLFVALAGTDQIAVVDAGREKRPQIPSRRSARSPKPGKHPQRTRSFAGRHEALRRRSRQQLDRCF